MVSNFVFDADGVIRRTVSCDVRTPRRSTRRCADARGLAALAVGASGRRRGDAAGNVPADVGFPLVFVPGSAVAQVVTRPRVMTTCGRAQLPVSYSVISKSSW